MINCVVYQSLRDGQAKPVQQISDLFLDGVSSQDATSNTDSGVLYGSFFQSGSYYILNLYSDATKIDLVASATGTDSGILTITEANESGLSGTVNFIGYSSDDTNIKVITLLSMDKDLPMNNLEGLADYDQDTGFAAFHAEAFKKLQEFIITRNGSQLWNPELIMTSQINGGTGGYDLSRVLNWQHLKDASRYYAFYLIAEKQDVEEGTFSRRAEQSKQIFKGYCQNTELQFDSDNDRVPNKVRSLSSWKFSRGG